MITVVESPFYVRFLHPLLNVPSLYQIKALDSHNVYSATLRVLYNRNAVAI